MSLLKFRQAVFHCGADKMRNKIKMESKRPADENTTAAMSTMTSTKNDEKKKRNKHTKRQRCQRENKEFNPFCECANTQTMGAMRSEDNANAITKDRSQFSLSRLRSFDVSASRFFGVFFSILSLKYHFSPPTNQRMLCLISPLRALSLIFVSDKTFIWKMSSGKSHRNENILIFKTEEKRVERSASKIVRVKVTESMINGFVHTTQTRLDKIITGRSHLIVDKRFIERNKSDFLHSLNHRTENSNVYRPHRND